MNHRRLQSTPNNTTIHQEQRNNTSPSYYPDLEASSVGSTVISSGQVYSAIANFRSWLTLPNIAFESDSQPYLDRHTLEGTIIWGEMVLSSPKTVTRAPQLGQALHQSNRGDSPVGD